MTQLVRTQTGSVGTFVDAALPPRHGESESAAQETAQDAPQAAPSRWKKIGTVAALSAASLVGVGKITQGIVGNNWEATWGTVENPHFRISPTAQLGSISTYRSDTQSLKESLLHSREVAATNELAAQRLCEPGVDASERKSAALALYAKLFGPNPRSSEQLSNSPRSSPVPEAFHPEKPATVYGRELVEQMLGSPLPKELAIHVGDISMAGIGGFANILTSDVTIEESTVFPSPRENYFEMVGITAHEVGHQTFRYAEERYLGWAPWNGASYETTVREEAVAVLFRALVGSQLSDPGERFLVIGNIQTLAEKHYEGKQDYGLNEGAALADAALTLYSDPRQAYAAMTTPGPLDPALRAIIEENRTLYLEVKALMKEDARNSQNLREKLQQIIDSK